MMLAYGAMLSGIALLVLLVLLCAIAAAAHLWDK